MKKNLVHRQPYLVFCFLLIIIHFSIHAQNQLSRDEFKSPPDKVKVHTWWHWLDGNITSQGITSDLEAMKAQGIIQATILNVGLFGDRDFGVKKVNFNTPEWFDMFQWALKEANRLGITIGVHNCDGWSTSGGPWITPEMSMKQFVWTKTIVNASQASIVLKQPVSIQNYYRDVAVVAMRSDVPLNSFHRAAPVVSVNDGSITGLLADGCPASSVRLDNGNNITFKFTTAFTAEKINVLPRKTFIWTNPGNGTSTYSISSSDDGKTYRKIKEFTIKGLNSMVSVSFDKTTARYFQLALVNTQNMDNWIPLYIGECELLPENEKPMYAPEIEYLTEKTGEVKAADENSFYGVAKISATKNVKEVIDLTSKMNSDGTLNWKPSEGNWTIIRFGYTTTGAVNSPATASGIGLECDKMDTVALNLHFNSFPLKMIEKAGAFAGNTFKFMLIDSWEAGFQNWTQGMMKEFELRRGYSLTSHIPVLCGESSGNTETDEAVLFDFRKTIAELIENNYYKHFGDLLHKHKLEFHAEIIYGGTNYSPLDILKTTQYVDLPMYEFWSETDDKRIVTYRPTAGIELNMPACAAIGYDKPVMASEAYTGFAHYSETPAGLKPFGDKAYCAGINQMILHSYVHQPNDNKPGMTLGQFASHFNRNNSYWQFSSEWMNYQARIQDVLQQGVASSDVLYYLGDQLPQFLAYNNSNLLPFGYMFNSCNFDILKNRITVSEGELVLNHKTSYALLCLPPQACLNFETLQRLDELVRDGAILYGPKPVQMLSLSDINNHKQAFDKLVSNIWGKTDGKTITSNTYGKGRVYWGIPIAEVLQAQKILPDITTRQNDATNFLFIHKNVAGNDVYFVMNQQNQLLHREMSFRVTGKTPEMWDAENGNTTNPAVYTMDENYTTLPVSLKPYQSLLFVFRNQKPAEHIQRVVQNGQQIFPATNAGEVKAIPGIVREGNAFVAVSAGEGAFQFTDNMEKKYTLTASTEKEFVLAYSGKIMFEPGYSASIQPVLFTKLQWLTESENADVKYFAGTARYTISFTFPIEEIKTADSVLLDLGEFESVAEAKLNGLTLGRIWKPGTYLPVKGILKAENTLEVAVAIVYRNRFIGDFVQYGEVRNLWTSSPITDFLNKDYPLKPSGLKGPLRVVAITKQVLK